MKKLDLLLSIFLIFVANSQYVQAQDKVTVKGTVSSQKAESCSTALMSFAAQVEVLQQMRTDFTL